MDEAEVALLDDVEERQTRRLVLLGDRYDEPQVRVDELAVRLLTEADAAPELTALGGGELLRRLELGARHDAGLDGLREAYLVVLGQQVVTTDVLEVEADEVLVVAVFTTGLHVLCGHSAAFRCRRRAGLGEGAICSVIDRSKVRVET